MTTQRWLFNCPRLWGLFCGLTLAVAQFFTPAGVGTAHAATTNCTPNGLTQSCTVTFDYSGAAETWTVPPGVTGATFDLSGAQGGQAPYGGKGGRVTATLNVTPGANYQILVGGSPGNSANPGFNGGGSGNPGASGGGGGGASDVRTPAFALADRILVGGGGGGGSTLLGTLFGGAGGYPNGGKGSDAGRLAGGGGGGTQTAGGAGGSGDITAGTPGSLGQGGNGASGSYSSGGGGGYYGGGGGGVGGTSGAAGGGGSSFGPTGATFQNGVREGNGLVIISYTQSDTSAPVANPTQSPPAAPSGWNNTNVTVTWNWTDHEPVEGYTSGIDAANCTTSSISSGSGIINLSATCKDLAGNTGTATYRLLVDPTAPFANPSQNPAANAAGWNNTDVTVNWNWAFTGAIIDTANCTVSSTSSGEGNLTLSATCRDVATNQRTVPYTVKVDKTAPVVTVTGVSAGATYTLGSVPTAACNTTDGVSGVATQAIVSVTGGNADGIGSFTATCSPATDVAGNSAAGVSVSYSVVPPPTATPTNTPVPPTATATHTTVPPTATNTPVPPTATATNTPVPPTATATNTPVPPTATATNTPVPPTATATNTPVPPTATATNTPVQSGALVYYLSSASKGKVGGVSYQDEDILRYSPTTGWSLFFDGSDVGVGNTDVDAFHLLADDTILMSFEQALSLPPLGAVGPFDIVRFTPRQLGTNTVGSFSRYFDGSAVGLETGNENIDALALDAAGNLVISTVGTVNVPGVTGQDEDLLTFIPTSLGANTAGTWELLLDGSTLALTADSEDLSALWIDPTQGNRYLATKGKFLATGAQNSSGGDSDDLFGCTPSGPSCIFFAFFDGDLVGFNKSIDGASLDLQGNGSNFASLLAPHVETSSEDTEAVPQFALLPDAPVEPDAEYDAFDQPLAEEAAEALLNQLFLPLVTR